MVPEPVVKLVEDAVAVQVALSSARLSVTVTEPRAPLIVVPGAPEPRLAAVGAVMVSAPLVTANVTVVSGSLDPPAAGAVLLAGAGVAEADAAGELSVLADAAAGASATPMTAAAPQARTDDVRKKSPQKRGARPPPDLRSVAAVLPGARRSDTQSRQIVTVRWFRQAGFLPSGPVSDRSSVPRNGTNQCECKVVADRHFKVHHSLASGRALR